MGQYRVILADPPWQYRVWNEDTSAAHGAAKHHYPTMTLGTIKALPVAALADRNAALLLWVTMPCLPQGLQVMEAWGFEFKTTAFTWVKLNRNGTPFLGLGHYTRGNAELCLLGTRGRIRRQSASVPQVLFAGKRQHSRKPDEQYDRIMRLFAGPYCEVFARQRWPGWDVWGNQTARFPAQPFLMPEAV